MGLLSSIKRFGRPAFPLTVAHRPFAEPLPNSVNGWWKVSALRLSQGKLQSWHFSDPKLAMKAIRDLESIDNFDEVIATPLPKAGRATNPRNVLKLVE